MHSKIGNNSLYRQIMLLAISWILKQTCTCLSDRYVIAFKILHRLVLLDFCWNNLFLLLSRVNCQKSDIFGQLARMVTFDYPSSQSKRTARVLSQIIVIDKYFWNLSILLMILVPTQNQKLILQSRFCVNFFSISFALPSWSPSSPCLSLSRIF